MTMKRERGIRGSKGYVKVLDFSVWNSDFFEVWRDSRWGRRWNFLTGTPRRNEWQSW